MTSFFFFFFFFFFFEACKRIRHVIIFLWGKGPTSSTLFSLYLFEMDEFHSVGVIYLKAQFFYFKLRWRDVGISYNVAAWYLRIWLALSSSLIRKLSSSFSLPVYLHVSYLLI